MSRGGTFHCPIGISLKRALILLADFTESEGVPSDRSWQTPQAALSCQMSFLSSGTGRRKFPWQRQRRTRPDIGGSLRTEYAADGTSPLQTHFWYRRVHTMGSWGRGSRGFTWTRERSRFRRAYPARRSPSHQRLSTKQAGPRRDRLEPTIWARRKTSLVCCQSAS